MTNSENRKLSIVILIFIVSLLSLSLFPYFLKFNGKLSDSNTDWGCFGDYISGTVGTGVNIIGAAVIIFAFLYQKKEFDNSINNQLQIIKNQEINNTIMNLSNIQDRIDKILDNEVNGEMYQFRNVKLRQFFIEFTAIPQDIPVNTGKFDTKIFRELAKLLRLESEHLIILNQYSENKVLFQIYYNIEHGSIIQALIKCNY